MAEYSFREVMKQWRRMCERLSGQGACAQFCPICANPVCGELKDARDEQIARAETAIMVWAAEHPEPVYPTWGEWLMQIGVMGRTPQDMPNPYFVMAKVASPIPSDIAQKLGIEPKEG